MILLFIFHWIKVATPEVILNGIIYHGSIPIPIIRYGLWFAALSATGSGDVQLLQLVLALRLGGPTSAAVFELVLLRSGGWLVPINGKLSCAVPLVAARAHDPQTPSLFQALNINPL